MPLRSVDPATGSSVQAFDLSPNEWMKLGLKNKNERHLRMPCCSSQVVLRRSRRGTQFFAHKAVGVCSTGPETEAHLRLKQLAAQVARDHGWDAGTEIPGPSSEGQSWIADVLAVKGRFKVA